MGPRRTHDHLRRDSMQDGVRVGEARGRGGTGQIVTHRTGHRWGGEHTLDLQVLAAQQLSNHSMKALGGQMLTGGRGVSLL